MRLKKYSTLCLCCLAVVLVFPFCAAADENAPTRVGSEICKECHEAVFSDFSDSRHGVTQDSRTPGAGMGCESCHGPGSVHAEQQDPGSIIGWTSREDADQDKKNAMCLSCHMDGKMKFWIGSVHETRGLSCTDCHRIHNNKDRNLLKSDEISTCNTCHKRVRAELVRQSHHPIEEGKISCSDCHNAHGAISDKLVDAQMINMKCFECHADKRGPYLWEHMPVTEDCMTCHSPHGSSRDNLLNAKMPFLCQRCHSNSGHAGALWARRAGQEDLSVYQASRNRLFYKSCINCHSQIHGSNHPSGKNLLR